MRTLFSVMLLAYLTSGVPYCYTSKQSDSLLNSYTDQVLASTLQWACCAAQKRNVPIDWHKCHINSSGHHSTHTKEGEAVVPQCTKPNSMTQPNKPRTLTRIRRIDGHTPKAQQTVAVPQHPNTQQMQCTSLMPCAAGPQPSHLRLAKALSIRRLANKLTKNPEPAAA